MLDVFGAGLRGEHYDFPPKNPQSTIHTFLVIVTKNCLHYDIKCINILVTFTNTGGKK